MTTPPVPLEVRAGPLKAAFYPDELFLRYVEMDGQEALRGTYIALRDENWDTITPAVEIRQQDISEEACELSFISIWKEGPIHFEAECRLTGTADGTFQFSFKGQSRHTFRTNRLGFVVLHGAQLSGHPVEGTHPDGTAFSGQFPERISPHQPYFALRSLRHELRGGNQLDVRMEGDTFEMEDQRNWTDASYKTYCTPLAKPFPRDCPTGHSIAQSITVRLVGKPHKETPEQIDKPTLRLDPDSPSSPFPEIGVTLSGDLSVPYTQPELNALKALGLDHLRCSWEQLGSETVRLAEWLALPLEVVIKKEAAPPKDAPRYLKRISGTKASIKRVLLVPENPDVLTDALVTAWREQLDCLENPPELIVGTDSYFTELNRNRPPMNKANGVCYSINPQVHAFDDASLLETLAMQGLTAANAKEIGKGKHVAVSPVTLLPRFNPNATTEADDEDAVPAPADPRQSTPFGFAWACGSLLHLAASPADSITYFETRGKHGLFESDPSDNPDAPASGLPGTLFPLYQAFLKLMGFKGGQVQRLESTHSFQFTAACFTGSAEAILAVVNFRDNAQSVKIDHPQLPQEAAAQQVYFAPGDIDPTEVELVVKNQHIELPGYSLTLISISNPNT